MGGGSSGSKSMLKSGAEILATRKVLARERSDLMAVLKETVRELVAQELEILLFPERNAFVGENGGRSDGPHPRLLETPYGRAKLRVPRHRKARLPF